MNTNNAPHAISAKPVATPQTNTIELAGFVFERTTVNWIDLALYTELESLDAIYSDSFEESLKAIKAIAKKEAKASGETTYVMDISFAEKGMKEGLPVIRFDAVYMDDVDAYTAHYSVNKDDIHSEYYRCLDAAISMFYDKSL